ncbi:hypothetical protein [Glycomyces albidus]|uniref:Uncharacterized protein n=1 Tax=Glycomyces albidus TaxID=2656774 RepID=A0A6L5G620_9ACTN|nr:hypothetical protein [Glycomyces albidus]MQM25099.1 hypothetical protein [Glycomyces albidus]
MDDFRSAGNAVHGARRIWVPLVVVGVLFALTAVEGLAAKALPDGEALAAGTVIEFGSARQVAVQVGEGWTLDESASDLRSRLVLVRDDVVMQLSVIVFSAGRPDGVREIWDGMAQTMKIEEYRGTEVALGEPAAFDTKWTSGGLQGSLQVETRVGAVYVLPAEDGAQAVEATVLGPLRPDPAVWDAAIAVVDSVAFAGEEGA